MGNTNEAKISFVFTLYIVLVIVPSLHTFGFGLVIVYEIFKGSVYHFMIL